MRLSMPRFMISEHPLPWLLPLIAMLLAFAVFPLAYNIYLSFHEFAIFKRSLVFVGWDNWLKLFDDTRLNNALFVNIVYTIVCLTVQLVLGFLIAMLLDSDVKGFGLMRALFSLALVIPPAVTGMMFKLLEDPQFGMFAWLLDEFHILSRDIPILATSELALIGVMIADIWQWTPFVTLIFLAGLRGLPKEPFESAMIDGASQWTITAKFTIPMLSKVIAVAVLIRGIDLFRTFDYIYVMTSGGPGIQTYTLSFYTWKQFATSLKWGYGATLSLLALIIINVAANLLIKFAKIRW
ncbi:Various polyols ABC transporter, permease component 1 [Olavius algarvensis Delta 1 endosymbiont]|nr:Various polyols ABC transporter, permease component 1 [Olavius algarvensis Delta 1 endosymbiont]